MPNVKGGTPPCKVKALDAPAFGSSLSLFLVSTWQPPGMTRLFGEILDQVAKSHLMCLMVT